MEHCHRCFLIPEIVNLICNAVNKFPDHDRRRTLATLARTCNIFHDPALNYLWRKVHRVSALIKCMPSDLWREERTSKGVILHFTRAIVPTDWIRFKLYARRIKKLFSCSEAIYRHHEHIATETYLALSLAAGTAVLLPNIQCLKWQHREASVFSYIHLFLGPRITRLELLLEGNEIIQLSLLPALCMRYPALQKLQIISLNTSDAQIKAISTAVCSWTQLRTLEVRRLTPKALKHVASLPYLKKLTLNYGSDDEMEYASFYVPKGFSGFPALTVLDISGCFSITLPVRLIQTMSSCPLERLLIHNVYSPASVGWKNLFGALPKHCSHESLLTISLSNDQWATPLSAPELHEHCMKMDVLRPLLVFSNLSFVDLDLAGELDLDDADVKILAMAWPRLQHLSFSIPFSESRPKPRMTLLGLLSFAEYCPIMTVLNIVVDASNVGPFNSRPGRGISNPSLCILTIKDSPICDILEVASFLSDVFPQITRITGFGSRPSPPSEEQEHLDTMWEEVERLLPMLVSIRSQERAYHGDARSPN